MFNRNRNEVTKNALETRFIKPTPQQQAQVKAQKYLDEFSTAEYCRDDNGGMHSKGVPKDNMIVYAKTKKGKTISIAIDRQRTAEQKFAQVERRTGIPKEQQHFVSQGRVLKDGQNIDRYNNKKSRRND